MAETPKKVVRKVKVLFTEEEKIKMGESIAHELSLLADIMIRVMDLAAFKGIDLEKHIDLKMKYNSLRPHKHGKKY